MIRYLKRGKDIGIKAQDDAKVKITVENIIQDIELIKDAKNTYEIFSLIKDIEEKSEYIFQDTLDFSNDFSENKNLSDECIQALIKLSNLGVFND